MSVLSFPSRLSLLSMVSLSIMTCPVYVFAQDDFIVVDSDAIVEVSPPPEENLGAKDVDSVSVGDTSISAPSAVATDTDTDTEEEDMFFDAGDIVPQGEMTSSAPIKVNPVTQPGSKYIIVKKNHQADSKTARLVSAERAMALGRYDAALLMFDNLYEINKKDARVLMGRAATLQKLERFDEAMQMYEALSKVAPKNIDAKINMLGLLGTRYPSVALRRLINLHDGNRNNVQLTAQIAITYANTGDFKSAITYLGMASSMEPNNANHIFNMAVISERAGDNVGAVSYYEKALEIDTIYGAGRSIPRDTAYERLAQIR